MGDANYPGGPGQPQDQQQQAPYGQYQQQQQPPYGGADQQAWGGDGQAYPPQPTYGAPPPYSVNLPQLGDKDYSFDQAFKLEKPKYNDVWAGLVVSRLPSPHPPGNHVARTTG